MAERVWRPCKKYAMRYATLLDACHAHSRCCAFENAVVYANFGPPSLKKQRTERGTRSAAQRVIDPNSSNHRIMARIFNSRLRFLSRPASTVNMTLFRRR